MIKDSHYRMGKAEQETKQYKQNRKEGTIMQKNTNMNNYKEGGDYLGKVPFNPVDWIQSECTQCHERSYCFDRSNRIVRGKRLSLVTKLGFCEDYDFDHNSVPTNRSQSLEDVETFDDAWGNGEFPIDE